MNNTHEYKYITFETLENDRVVRIMLNRERTRNAQNRGLLVELDHALNAAEEDDSVRVIILGGTGSMFSSGHDLGSEEFMTELQPGPEQHRSYQIHGGTKLGAEQRMLQEWHYFFQNTLRWRNLRKITIAEVHGPVFAAGLMLAWSCDLIVAAEGTTFADVVGTRLGMCGLEYFAHPWEFGLRKAKEMLLTGDSMDVDEAYRLGMVSKVFAADDLRAKTEELADRIASLPSVTSVLIKESVNQSQDNMGFFNSLQACFTLHQLNHAHWGEVNESGIGMALEDSPGNDLPGWRDAPPIVPMEKGSARGSS